MRTRYIVTTSINGDTEHRTVNGSGGYKLEDGILSFFAGDGRMVAFPIEHVRNFEIKPESY